MTDTNANSNTDIDTETDTDTITLTVAPEVAAAGVTCYECGAAYGYLGADPHPGCCHHCGADAVDPAGRLTYERCDALEVATSADLPTSTMRIIATDARDREFEYWLHLDEPTAADATDAQDADNRQALLWRVYVDGTRVVPTRVAGTHACPLSAIEDLLADTVPERFRADVVTPVIPDQLDSKWEQEEWPGDTTTRGSVDPDEDEFDDGFWW